MENLPFIIWLLLYPLICDIRDYIVSKRRKTEGKQPMSNEADIASFFIQTAIYLSVAFYIYAK